MWTHILHATYTKVRTNTSSTFFNMHQYMLDISSSFNFYTLGYQNVPRIFGLVDPPFCAAKSCNIPYTCEDMWVVLLPYYFHVRNPYSVWEDCGNGVQCPTSAELNFNGMVKADNWNGWSGKFIRKSWIGWKNTPWFLKIPVDSCFIRYLSPVESRAFSNPKAQSIMVGTSLTWKDAESDDSSFQNFVVPYCSPLAINMFDAPQSDTKSKLSTCLDRKKTENSYSIDAFKPCVRCLVGLKTGLTQAHTMAVSIYISGTVL